MMRAPLVDVGSIGAVVEFGLEKMAGAHKDVPSEVGAMRCITSSPTSVWSTPAILFLLHLYSRLK